MLLYPPGLEFIQAFFGCLYAGIVAVPISPPRRKRSSALLKETFHAANPSLVLSTSEHLERARETYAAIPSLLDRPWIATDRIDDHVASDWSKPQISSDDLAFLQYTSGSTATPKGVMLSHENLISNSALINGAFEASAVNSAVFWLPLYHDMGLIGGVIQPIYCGGSATLLAPAAFLQRPLLWLETISRTGATISGGPDFAYDLCARKIAAGERHDLDLSRWELAFTGAEPIRAGTLERFANAFADCGFRREALYPCYGLAEATLIVTGGPRRSPPTIVHIDATVLAKNEVRFVSESAADARELVGSGGSLPGQQVVIADLDHQTRCVDGHVGEIWVRGPSVAQGYYNLPEVTQSTFQAHLADTGEGPFLRTGDLGFCSDGQLFVTGRLKDLIIIRGQNYYPQDIEQTAEKAYRGLRAGHCAAFSIEVDDHEQLVVVQEIEPRHRKLDTHAALLAIRGAISAEHELETQAILLVKAGTVPKTTSGKTRRFAIRELYSERKLLSVAQWNADMSENKNSEERPINGHGVTAEQIESWLVNTIAARVYLAREEIDVNVPFQEFGLGSLEAIETVNDLEKWLGRELSPTTVYNYPTIRELAHYLMAPPPAPATSGEPSQTTPPPQDVDPVRMAQEVRQLSDEDMEAFILGEMAKSNS